MKEILNDEFNRYILYEDEIGQFWLDVSCGTVFLYDALIKLLPDEVNEFKKRKGYLDELSFQIAKDPEKYLNRNENKFNHTIIEMNWPLCLSLYNNAGWTGGRNFPLRLNCNFVTIVIKNGTNKLITSFPSLGY